MTYDDAKRIFSGRYFSDEDEDKDKQEEFVVGSALNNKEALARTMFQKKTLLDNKEMNMLLEFEKNRQALLEEKEEEDH